MISTYLKIAWRNAKKNRSFTFISLGSLVLGITLFFFISLWAKDELSYDQYFKGSPVYRVDATILTKDGATSRLPSVGWPVGKRLASDYPEIDKVSYLRNWYPIIKHRESYLYEDALYADEHFFSVFGFELQEGNPATALTTPYSVVITQELKEKYFGTTPALGKVLMVSDTIPYTITGILKKLPAPLHLRFDMIGSFSSFCASNPGTCEEEFTKGWFDMNVYNYVRLHKTASAPAVAAKIKDLVQRDGKESVASTGFRAMLDLQPAAGIYLHSGMITGKGTTGNYRSIRIFFMIGIFILVIACLNYVNLSTARSIERAKEIGIQKVLGNSRFRLIRQFLTEATLFCVVAAIFSLLLMMVLLPLFNEFGGKSFGLHSLFSFSNLLLLVTIIAILIPLAGFYPALVLSSFKPVIVLKGSFVHNSGGTLLRKILVIVQFVISAGFIMSTAIVWKQMQFMQQQDLGFDKDKILLINAEKVPWTLRNGKTDLLKRELLSIAGAKMVSSSFAVPGRHGWNGQFAYPEGQADNKSYAVEHIAVDADYVKTFGLHLVAGRDFMRNNKSEEESFIINEAAAQYLGWGNATNAIGKKLSVSGIDGHVVGVTKNYHQHGLQKNIKAIVLSPIGRTNFFALKYETNPQQVIAGAQAAWNKVFKGYTMQYNFLDEDFQQQYEKEAKQQAFFSLAAILSIVIGCLGLLGLAIFTAQKRTKEIGIRKVAGASESGIALLLSRDLLKQVAIATLIAIPLAWWTMHNWLQSFDHRTSLSWWIFAFAGIATLVIALATISFQAVKAARTSPVNSLRSE